MARDYRKIKAQLADQSALWVYEAREKFPKTEV
jgi:hypothetical protein